MTAQNFHLCPTCSRRFTPKYKVGSYRGGKILCPRCQKAAQPPKQARRVLELIEWAREAGIAMHFSKDLGGELLYVCGGEWSQFDASVDKVGRISVSHCLTEHTVVYDKRRFMELVQRHRVYVNGGMKSKSPTQSKSG